MAAYLTGPLGQALADTNDRLINALAAAGICAKKRRTPIQHFEQDEVAARRVAQLGRALAGEMKPQWVDFKDAPPSPMYRPPAPMSEETKEVLRARRAALGPVDRGDYIAVLFRAAESLEDVYVIAGEYLGIPPAELAERYKHLNPGQQRMVCGNMARAKYKKDHP